MENTFKYHQQRQKGKTKSGDIPHQTHCRHRLAVSSWNRLSAFLHFFQLMVLKGSCKAKRKFHVCPQIWVTHSNPSAEGNCSAHSLFQLAVLPGCLSNRTNSISPSQKTAPRTNAFMAAWAQQQQQGLHQYLKYSPADLCQLSRGWARTTRSNIGNGWLHDTIW